MQLSMVEEIEMLREQNRQLQSVLKERPVNGYRKLGVVGMKAELLGVLMKHGTMSRALAMEALYGHQADQPDPKIIEVMLSNLRKLLAPHTIGIGVYYNVGWYISPEHKKLIRELCA